MTPTPLEGQQNPHSGSGGCISLNLLIDFILQRTYHELTVLAELLPRKTDLERKIEIVQFASRTRQLFVRLLALVKWGSSASKVDRSASIMGFLDKQSMLFIETADSLSRLSRENLVAARLPNFHLPAAVEVLTTGTYSRLPTCIRDRIIPPDAITPSEKRSTLQRLNQIIQYRLVTTELPNQMKNFKINNGRVIIMVDHEFEVSLTLTGEGPSIPWRLLDIDFLVEDKETGDGKSLVHSLQIRFLRDLVQSRLLDSSRPLPELYTVLHTFTQSLQLEVLHSQTGRLCRERLGNYIRVEDYQPGRFLTVAYWRELSGKDAKSQLGYKLTAQMDSTDMSRPLIVSHSPPLNAKEDFPERAIRSYLISMERLLVHTIHVRSKQRLQELKQKFQSKLPGVECTVDENPPASLSVPVLQPCMKSEVLLITVDTHTGSLLPHVPQIPNTITADIQSSLNSHNHAMLDQYLGELRFHILVRHVEMTLQQLPASSHLRLPLMHAPQHPITKIDRHRIYIRLHRHPTAILIVEVKGCTISAPEGGGQAVAGDIELGFYLAIVKPASIEDDPNDDSVQSPLPKAYLKVTSMMELDTFLMSHGPFTKVIDTPEKTGTKRKQSSGIKSESSQPTKKPRVNCYFLPEIAHAVAMCDERIPFAALCHELEKSNIPHGGVTLEAGGNSLVVQIVRMPSVEGVREQAMNALREAFLSLSIRSQLKPTTPLRFWVVTILLVSSPLQSKSPKEQGSRRAVYYTYDQGSIDASMRTVQNLLNDWTQIAQLYDLVLLFTDYLEEDKHGLVDMMTVKSFTYRKLVLGYGPNHTCVVTVQWSPQEKKFLLSFGMSGGGIGTPVHNPHSIMREQLQQHLNRHRNLAYLLSILHETYQPLLSISKLPTTPQLGMMSQRPLMPIQTFVVIPQSPFHVRIAFCAAYCLDVQFRSEGLVSIKDGAYSLFDKAKVIEEFTPTPGLKAFLSQYVDESAVMMRRRSQSEDDNPPSPVVTADGEGGLKFHTPATPPMIGSNPHTPASPHTGGQVPYGSSPAASFSLASPPPTNTRSPNPSPSMPSPGFLPTASPSNPQVGMSPAAPSYPGQVSSSSVGVARTLPQRSWAGAIPTILTHEGLESMCTPLPNCLHCPLERFLGCVSLKRYLQKLLHEEKEVTLLKAEAAVVAFKVDVLNLTGRVTLDTQTQALKLKLQHSAPEAKPQLTQEDLKVLEWFFDSRVVVFPIKPNNLNSFCRILLLQTSVPPHLQSQPPSHASRILKELVNIIRLELMPPQQGKWQFQWCLTIPSSSPQIAPIGLSAIIVKQPKILFFIQLQRAIPSQPHSVILILPIVYDMVNNTLQVADKREPPSTQITLASQALKRVQDFANSQSGECALTLGLKDLVMNLQVPPMDYPGPQMGMMQQPVVTSMS